MRCYSYNCHTRCERFSCFLHTRYSALLWSRPCLTFVYLYMFVCVYVCYFVQHLFFTSCNSSVCMCVYDTHIVRLRLDEINIYPYSIFYCYVQQSEIKSKTISWEVPYMYVWIAYTLLSSSYPGKLVCLCVCVCQCPLIQNKVDIFSRLFLFFAYFITNFNSVHNRCRVSRTYTHVPFIIIRF